MSETELRQLLADAAELAPTTLDRRIRPAHRRTGVVAAAAVATAAVAVSVALLASPRPTAAPADGSTPGSSPTATSAAVDGLLPVDGLLTVAPVGDGQPGLSRAEAEVVMLNSWPPPPLRALADMQQVPAPVRMGLASVRLSPDVHRVRGEVPDWLDLAWVVTWITPEGSRVCPSAGVTPMGDSLSRLHAYVLAADGSSAYVYQDPSEGCLGQELTRELRAASVQVAVNRTAVPWDGSRRDANGDVLMTFSRPPCATAGGLSNEQGTMIFVEVPVGTSCAGSVTDSIRTGPTEPAHHPLLGPFRTENGVELPPLSK